MALAETAAWEVYADVVLQRAALGVRVLRGEPPTPLAGIVIDDDEIASLLRELPGLRSPNTEALCEVLTSTSEQLAGAEQQLAAGEDASRFDAIVYNAGLDVESTKLLALALAIEMHPARQLLVAYVNDDVSRRWLTPASVVRALGPEAIVALGTDSPLVRCGLLTVDGDTAWSLNAVRVPASLVAAAAGAPGRDADLPRDARVVEHDDDEGEPFVLVHGADPSARIETATAHTSGRRFLVTRSPGGDAAWEAVVRQCVVGGLSAIVEVGTAVTLSETDRWWIDRVDHLPIAVCSAAEIKLDTLPDRPFREYTAVSTLRDVGGGHLLDGRQAALVDKAVMATGGDPHAAVRRLVTGNLDAHAGRTKPGREWDELVLPPHHIEVLRELVARYRHRHTVYHDWGFPARPSTGVTTLFAGPSGTGKTMAAEVIASALGLDLYRIDLSAVVSKYIGETEKNLEEIFTASAAGSLVLLFDEADALFGKRSEVSDAHDRYANIEVAYLLQRLERYDGFVIMATNLRNNIDSAFLRRIDLALEFEVPDAEQRRSIWNGIFPDGAPLGDIDVDVLAGEYDVAGGTIRNAAVHAAFLAAADGSEIGMDHVVAALAREFQKMGRLRTARPPAQVSQREVAHVASAG